MEHRGVASDDHVRSVLELDERRSAAHAAALARHHRSRDDLVLFNYDLHIRLAPLP
jgi:hypothetical protein